MEFFIKGLQKTIMYFLQIDVFAVSKGVNCEKNV